MSATRRPVLLLGTTPYAEVIFDMFEDDPLIEIVGFIENYDETKVGTAAMSLPVHWYKDCKAFKNTHGLVGVLGTTMRRAWIEEMVDYGYGFDTLIYTSSIVSKRSEIGVGSMIDAGTVVAGFTSIAPHVRIGRKCCIGHHTSIGSFSTVHPGAIVSGKSVLGGQVTVGTGAVLVDGIEIGNGAYIAAGAIVIHDVPERALVAGNPAKIVQENYGPK